MKYLCFLLVLLISLPTASHAVNRLNVKLNFASDTLLKPLGFDVDSLNCITIGIEPLQGIRFLFYPQPASEYLIVEMPEKANHLQIVSNSGTVVFEKAAGSLLKEQLNLSSLPPGLYLIQITLSSGRVLSEKLIKSVSD